MNVKTIKSNCLKRWGDSDIKIEEFRTQFEIWITQFPNDYHEICCKLINKFEYYSRKRILKNLEQIHLDLLNDFGINYDQDTILTFIKATDGRVNSSTEYVVEFKNLTKINKHSIIDDIYMIDEDWENIKKIVFIDDCSGSGKTFKKYLEKNLEKFMDKKIYLIVIHLMEEGKRNIEDFARANNLSINIFYINVFDKAFSHFIFEESEIEESLKKTVDISKKFQIRKSEILGFENSQALMAFYSGTPNNTIGYFIKNTKKYNALFPREYYKRPGWKSSSNDKQKRKMQNYQIALSEKTDG